MKKPLLVIGNKNYSSWSLRGWLAFHKLEAAFDPLVEHGFDHLQGLVESMHSEEAADHLTVEMLQTIGVDKPGHRYRLLAALEAEDTAETGPTTSVEEWLQSIDLPFLHSAFAEAGFEDFDSLVGLMTSKHALTHQVLAEDLGIANSEIRHRILASLTEESQKRSRSVFSGCGLCTII